jgi:glycosyltransferase involved in cell wall biosynthesis
MDAVANSAQELSVIIPMLNAAEHLHAALASVAAQRLYVNWEVIVADNGSTDGTLDIVESFRDRLPSLTIIDASDEKGRSHAVNLAVERSRGRSIVFFDADDVLAPGYLLAMSRALRAEQLVCARREVEGLNARHTWAIRTSSQMNAPMNSLAFLPFAGGGTLGVSRRLFDRIGGFDTSLRSMEDMDFCWRAQLEGGARLALVPAAVLHHRYRADARAVFHQTRQWGRDQARLRRVYAPHGMPRRSRLAPVRQLWNLRRVWRLHDPAHRYLWSRRLGMTVGRIEGGIAEAFSWRRRRP